MAARTAKESDSDTDFQEGHSAAEESAAEEGDEGAEPVDAKEIEAIKEKKKDNGELRGALSQPKELKGEKPKSTPKTQGTLRIIEIIEID